MIIYRKTCILASGFIRAIINMFIQGIFPSIITYFDRSFKEKKKGDSEMKKRTINNRAYDLQS